MTHITRRDVLQAGLALPGVVEAAYLGAPRSRGARKPKRFEEVVGFEVDEAIAGHPLAILPLGSLEFHGLHNPLGIENWLSHSEVPGGW